jgi:hypothetical protein
MSFAESGKGKVIYKTPEEILAYFKMRLGKDPESAYYKGMVKQMEINLGVGEEKQETITSSKDE